MQKENPIHDKYYLIKIHDSGPINTLKNLFRKGKKIELVPVIRDITKRRIKQ